MILVDTSAWIEFLRDTGSTVCNRVEVLIESEIAVCDAIRMEVLAGARNERHLSSLRGLLARAGPFSPDRSPPTTTRRPPCIAPAAARERPFAG